MKVLTSIALSLIFCAVASGQKVDERGRCFTIRSLETQIVSDHHQLAQTYLIGLRSDTIFRPKLCDARYYDTRGALALWRQRCNS
jgi:hypothetical protein